MQEVNTIKFQLKILNPLDFLNIVIRERLITVLDKNSDSGEKEYNDRSDNLILKINRASKLRESMLNTNSELKEKIKLLETQNNNLAEINQILKEKIERSRRNNSKSSQDQNSVSERSPSKHEHKKFCNFWKL